MSAVTDRELLRKYEPVLRFTRGEQFFPLHVEHYVRECSLWVQDPDRPAKRIVSEDELTLDMLGKQRTSGFGSIYFLQFIEPLNLAELASYYVKQTLKKRDPGDRFRAGRGRLSRVGYTSRILDALFSLSLLARGRVPGDRAAAASITYERIKEETRSYSYHGRVIRQSGWVVLQYWFFYVYNNWRSGFHGANDHEADWEMINIYLSGSKGENLHPEWVAYASHEFAGDDLRRRWDDPEVEKVGDHPVVYVGAGSHASYYAAGDYLTEIEVPLLSPFVRVLQVMKKYWRRWLRKTMGGSIDVQMGSTLNVFRIPFVDYARGDGFSIGESARAAWAEPVLLDPVPDWAGNYRGLWGYYARDPAAGENAPAGLCYNRKGKVRRAWYDPMGWAGLDKVPPRRALPAYVAARIDEVKAACSAILEQITQKQDKLYDLGVEANAMRDIPYMKELYQRQQEDIEDLSEELSLLREQLTENETLLNALSSYESDLHLGKQEPLRNHLQRPHRPEKESSLRLGWLAEVWSAISIGLMLIAFILLALFATDYLYYGLAAILSLIILIEAGFRRRLSNLINAVAIILAVICTILLVYEYFWFIIIGVVTIGSLYMIWQNLRELWS